MSEVGVGVAFRCQGPVAAAEHRSEGGLAARSAVRAGSANRHAAQGCAVMPAPPSARSAGAFGGSGRAFFCLLFFARAKKSRTPAAREPHQSLSSVGAADTSDDVRPSTSSGRTTCLDAWIPAFAGMTAKAKGIAAGRPLLPVGFGWNDGKNGDRGEGAAPAAIPQSSARTGTACSLRFRSDRDRATRTILRVRRPRATPRPPRRSADRSTGDCRVRRSRSAR